MYLSKRVKEIKSEILETEKGILTISFNLPLSQVLEFLR